MEIAGQVLKEIHDRLQFMLNVGLHYLTLDRPAPTLSGGEGQRIRLASQIGCGLVGVIYILDEPSIGLHARDNRALLDTLLRLRDMGNTVLVVEHDAETMRSADWLIDLGPGAGVLGGEVVAAGTPQDVAANPRSLTGRYLSGELAVVAPNGQHRRAPANGSLTVVGARLHNLKSIATRFPLGVMTCVTGVSGSGKSSLVAGTLYPALARALHGAQDRPGPHDRLEGLEHLDKAINITQSPIGRTPRSNPATYVGVFDEIRRVFANTPEARARGYKPDRFSFNVKGGRCEACKGHGQKRIEMHFLADVWVTCNECRGTRFNRETLAIRYRGKNIAQVLDMDVQEALTFFANHPKIARILQTLHDVGMDYVRLGQSATTLSGGEAQRVKLARELSRVATGRTVYILDEPTTGLHFADIQRLLDVLHRLVDAGNTVIVIEHNLDVIKTADWIIDLGPEGGEAGGNIIAQGPPEAVTRVESSYTGQFLRKVLTGSLSA
jgi:excinuclease ABC subunit A